MARSSKALLVACALIVPLGCNTSSPTAPEAGLAVDPSSVNLASGQAVQLTVIGEGNESVSWSSSNAAIATVDASGMVTGRFLAGGAVITARTPGSEGSAEVTVLRACANPVEIDGDPGAGSSTVAEFDVRFGADEDAAKLVSEFVALYGFRTLEVYVDGFRAELTTAQINSIVCRSEVATITFV